MKLDDKVIGHIAKVLQVAIITGTDIVDNLRTLELVAPLQYAQLPYHQEDNSGKLRIRRGNDSNV